MNIYCLSCNKFICEVTINEFVSQDFLISKKECERCKRAVIWKITHKAVVNSIGSSAGQSASYHLSIA